MGSLYLRGRWYGSRFAVGCTATDDAHSAEQMSNPYHDRSEGLPTVGRREGESWEEALGSWELQSVHVSSRLQVGHFEGGQAKQDLRFARCWGKVRGCTC